MNRAVNPETLASIWCGEYGKGLESDYNYWDLERIRISETREIAL